MMYGVADDGIVLEPDCSCPTSCPCAFQLLCFICCKNAIILTSNAVSQMFGNLLRLIFWRACAGTPPAVPCVHCIRLM